MALEYIGLKEINGPLVIIEGVQDVALDEMVDVVLDNGEKRLGQVVTVSKDKAVVQMFEGSTGLSEDNVVSHFTGHTMELAVSKEMLGRVFDGVGRPIDGFGKNLS